MYRFIIIVLVWFIPSITILGQCDLQISGHVYLSNKSQPLEFCNISMTRTGGGAITDSTGFFLLKGICPGLQGMTLQHVSGSVVRLNFSITSDTSIVVIMTEDLTITDEILVTGNRSENSLQASKVLSEDAIKSNPDKSLGDLVESISGVHVLKTGTNVSKPIVHGLSGNRIGIVNGGALHTGQQWGNDHAPEIDPLMANQITVIKGAGSLAYGGSSLGPIIVLDQQQIKFNKQLLSEFTYGFHTNGRGHLLHSKLSKSNSWGSWRISGSMKKFGDRKAPSHFLTNTGKQELNGSIQWQKELTKNLQATFYYSIFSMELGILRGSHIGNLTDLESAINRSTPFFTEPNFSYVINAPKQNVIHHLWNAGITKYISDQTTLKLKYIAQLNTRKEFDIRRGNRTKTPALSLNLSSHYVDAQLVKANDKIELVKSGIQISHKKNSNNPETGIKPLIPNYSLLNIGTYFILKERFGKHHVEAGLRYDFQSQNTSLVIGSSNHERDIRKNHRFSFHTGIRSSLHKDIVSAINLSWVRRAPDINELYSSGLHQGVSGIEEGSELLKEEEGFKLSIENDFSLFKNNLTLNILAFGHKINNYIYLQPQDQPRLTIRGAFPVFIYSQTDARLLGLDISLNHRINSTISWNASYSHVQGRDLLNDLNLVQIPSDHLRTTIQYNLAEFIGKSNFVIELNGTYTARPRELEASQLFVEQPKDYFLLGCTLTSKVNVFSAPLNISIKSENLLNKRYRNYLNRQRYFADEIGRNISITLSLKL